MTEYFLQKKMKKLFCSLLFCFVFFNLFCAKVFAIQSIHGLDGWQEHVIDATKNARLHSNMGNIYFSEGNYIGALKEYEIAYRLAHSASNSSAYLYNIARCSIMLGDIEAAKRALLGAINKDCINITYYKTLVDCFSYTNSLENELKNYIKDKSNPYNKIVVGLIYLKLGQNYKARAIFDDFIIENPDMIITADVKNILLNIK